MKIVLVGGGKVGTALARQLSEEGHNVTVIDTNKARVEHISESYDVMGITGNGSSITAIEGGKSIDTSMGFTPLDGVIMGTRCGSVDPSAVTFVANKLGLTPNEMSDYMNKKSGFLGISGISSDNRDITSAAEHGDHKAQLAGEMLRYEIKKFIGSYAAVMNGLDAVIFTGGIGENSDDVRADVCHNMEYLGIKLDDSVNHGLRGKLQKISAPDSKVEVWVVPTNEELLIARDTRDLVGNL